MTDELKNLKKKCPTFREFCEIKGLKEGDYYNVLDYIEYCDGLTSEQQIEITRKWLLKGVKTMNREILFRAWTVLEIKKVEGAYSPFPADERYCYITDKDSGQRKLCYAETVGQFTGLTDKNGKKIFEGDIVRYETIAHNGYEGIYKVVFEDRNGCGYFGIAYSDIETCDFCYSTPASQMEIIGDVYENKELFDYKEATK